MYAREAYRLHPAQEREELLSRWPEGKLKGLWNREKRRGWGVTASLRRIWRAITGRAETLPDRDLRLNWLQVFEMSLTS